MYSYNYNNIVNIQLSTKTISDDYSAMYDSYTITMFYLFISESTLFLSLLYYLLFVTKTKSYNKISKIIFFPVQIVDYTSIALSFKLKTINNKQILDSI